MASEDMLWVYMKCWLWKFILILKSLMMRASADPCFGIIIARNMDL